jgi:hypothetical protein
MTVNRVTCRRAVGYTTAGQTYEVEQERKHVYFHNVETGGSTSMPVWEFNAAMASGAMVAAEVAA